jgi:hypothetical protein
MKRAQLEGSLVATQAAQSLAVAMAVVFLAHLVAWMAAQGAIVADVVDDPPQMLLDSD